MTNPQCIGLILAGGRSTRMGQNKAFLQRDEQSMLAYCRTQLQLAQIKDIYISGEQSGGIKDIISDGGPLGGIYSVIKATNAAAMIVLPVDMPLLDHRHLSQLIHQGQETNIAQHFNQVHLPAYIPVTPQLTTFLAQAFSSPQFLVRGRGPSIWQLFSHIGAQSIELQDCDALFNANTPAQWQLSQTLIKL